MYQPDFPGAAGTLPAQWRLGHPELQVNHSQFLTNFYNFFKSNYLYKLFVQFTAEKRSMNFNRRKYDNGNSREHFFLAVHSVSESSLPTMIG